MKKETTINGELFKIEGSWALDGMNYCYKGTATKIKNNEKLPINCKIPLSAIKKFGKDLFEDDIEKSLVDSLSTKY